MYEYQKNKLKQHIPHSLTEYSDEWDINCWIAGGAITSVFTNSEVNDIDVYPKDEYSHLLLLDWMKGNTELLSVTPNSVLGFHNRGETRYIINVISLGNYPTAQHIFDNFDFSICKAAYCMKSEEFFFDNDFFVDLASRQLRVGDGTRFPLMSVIRIDKYTKRGYSISRNEMVKALLMVSKLKLDTLEEAEKHINGLYGLA